MSRRAKGTGSVKETEFGWKARLPQGKDSKGKASFRYRTFDTKREADKWLSDARGTVGMRDMTYERLALVWLRDKKQRVAAGELAVATFEIYRRTTLNHLIPRLGTLRVEDVKPIHIAAALSTDVKTKRKLGRASVQKFRSVLHNQFEQAVRHELIVRNPVASTERMGSSTAEVRQRGLTGEEFSALLKAAKGTDAESYVVLALMTGARPSELLALQYGDLDFKKNTVRFTASLGRVKIGGPTVRKAMKTSRSERTLSVPPQALDAFREKKGKADAFLFATSTGKPVNIRTFAQRVFAPFVTSAGMPSLTLYSLRHAHATMLLRNGEASVVAAKRLGHSSTKLFENVYAHAESDLDRAASDRLAELF